MIHQAFYSIIPGLSGKPMTSAANPCISSQNHVFSPDKHVPNFYRKTMFFFYKLGFSLVTPGFVKGRVQKSGLTTKNLV